jgi:hypothetical protein
LEVNPEEGSGLSGERAGEEVRVMKRFASIILFILVTASLVFGAGKDLEVRDRTLTSKKPPFVVALPSDLQWVHSSSVEHPSESSLTRTDYFIRDQKKQIDEMLIVQIAAKTNPQAGPMAIPPLKPFSEKRMVAKGKIKRGDVEVEFLIQLMAWNPDAPSLQPILKKGWNLPAQWAIQTQILFQPDLEQAVFLRYSKDTRSFGLKVSAEGTRWDKESISGNEKKVCEAFQKTVSGIMDSLRIESR